MKQNPWKFSNVSSDENEVSLKETIITIKTNPEIMETFERQIVVRIKNIDSRTCFSAHLMTDSEPSDSIITTLNTPIKLLSRGFGDVILETQPVSRVQLNAEPVEKLI